MSSPNGTTLFEVQEIINGIVTKAFDSVIKLNDIFMTSPKCTTLLEAKKNIHGTLIMVL